MQGLSLLVAVTTGGMNGFCAQSMQHAQHMRVVPLPAINVAAIATVPATIEAPPAELARRTRPHALQRACTSSAFLLINILVLAAVYPAVLLALAYGRLFDNDRRRASDVVVQVWARLTMTLFRAEVTVEGAELLPPPNEAVIYTPNHCAFPDVFVLSGFLPRRFKYVSKKEK
jgi:1-acyl-sn-glycerol-3-phosphate acyltransferase